MVKITEDLIRKRAEHNECIISTLEEISLHQQDIERIENLDKWCRDLRILYLQSNLIPRIENVGRLKKLEYLNLALNNIELIENLEYCESLQKLDLTVNFVGVLTSVETLKGLYNFKELYLTGNPCTEYVGYKEYVIAALPQLERLDGVEIEKSERIKAMQIFHENRPSIIQQQEIYKRKRQRQKEEELAKQRGEKNRSKSGNDWYTDIAPSPKIKEIIEDDIVEKTEEEKNQEFWDEKVAFTPESRIAVHEHMQEQRRREEGQGNQKKEKPKRILETPDGRILNVNEAKVDFHMTEDGKNVVLDVAVYKHMDTSLCDADVQPTHVRVMIKGKVLQLVLPEEVKPDSSSAKRSQTTGHLVITMPKVNPILTPHADLVVNKPKLKAEDKSALHNEKRHERLEVDPSKASVPDISNIVRDKSQPVAPPLGNTNRTPQERPNSDNFEDDPDVPPLL